MTRTTLYKNGTPTRDRQHLSSRVYAETTIATLSAAAMIKERAERDDDISIPESSDHHIRVDDEEPSSLPLSPPSPEINTVEEQPPHVASQSVSMIRLDDHSSLLRQQRSQRQRYSPYDHRQDDIRRRFATEVVVWRTQDMSAEICEFLHIISSISANQSILLLTIFARFVDRLSSVNRIVGDAKDCEFAFFNLLSHYGRIVNSTYHDYNYYNLSTYVADLDLPCWSKMNQVWSALSSDTFCEIVRSCVSKWPQCKLSCLPFDVTSNRLRRLLRENTLTLTNLLFDRVIFEVQRDTSNKIRHRLRALFNCLVREDLFLAAIPLCFFVPMTELRRCTTSLKRLLRQSGFRSSYPRRLTYSLAIDFCLELCDIAPPPRDRRRFVNSAVKTHLMSELSSMHARYLTELNDDHIHYDAVDEYENDETPIINDDTITEDGDVDDDDAADDQQQYSTVRDDDDNDDAVAVALAAALAGEDDAAVRRRRRRNELRRDHRWNGISLAQLMLPQRERFVSFLYETKNVYANIVLSHIAMNAVE